MNLDRQNRPQRDSGILGIAVGSSKAKYGMQEAPES